MFKSEYLGETDFFDTFEECKKYHGYENNATDINTVDDLNDVLSFEYNGMVSPVISEI